MSRIGHHLETELEARYGNGDPILVEALLVDHPELDRQPETVLSLLMLERQLRIESGEHPRTSEYQRRFPELATQLTRAIELHEALRQSPLAVGAHSGVEVTALTNPASGADAPIPGYDLEGELGRGGMAVVYKARHRKLGRPVALKLLREARADDPRIVQRLHDEAATLAQLNHAHLLPIYEIGEVDGRPYLALQYMPGGTLADRLDGKPWPAESAAALVATLADALATVHRAGIIHRDLKPANILFDSEGTPKVADFGLARDTNRDGQTESGEMLGTPNYMPPEQARAARGWCTPAIDVYALGAILYELLTGRPPFQGPSPTETLMLVLARDPVGPRRLQPKIPRDLETITLKCLQKAPRQRYDHAGDLAEDLNRLQSGRPIQARPVPFWERLWLQARRRPLAASALTTALLLAVTLLFGWWGFTLELADQRDRAKTERSEAQLASLRFTIDEAQDLCERGESGRGLVWYAEALRQIEGLDHPQVPALERVVRLSLAGWQHRVNPLVAVLDIPWSIYCLDVSDDGRWLVIGSRDRENSDLSGLVTVWAWSDGPPEDDRWEITHPQPVRSLAFHPERPLLATSCRDGVIRLWDLRRRCPAGPDWSLPAWARVVRFSPDGSELVVGCTDGRIGFRTWDDPKDPGHWLIDETSEVPDVGDAISGQVVHDLAFHDERPWLLSVGDQAVIRLWDLETGRPLARTPTMLHHNASIRCVAWHPDGRRFVTGSLNTRVRQWQLVKAPSEGGGWRIQTQGPVVEHAGSVRSVAYDAVGHRLLSGSGDGTVRLTDARTGAALRAPIRHRHGVRAARFLNGGTGIIAAGLDGAIRRYRVLPEPIQEVPLPERITALSYTSEGDRLIAALGDRAVHVLDASSFEPIGAPMPHRNELLSVLPDPTGRRLITRSLDESIRLWDLETRRPLGTSPSAEDVKEVRPAHFLGTTGQILIAQKYGPIGLWDPTADGRVWKPIATPNRDDERIVDTSAHPDGDAFVALIAPRNQWAESARLVHYRRVGDDWLEVGSRSIDPVQSVIHTPEGSRILTVTWDGLAQIRDTSDGSATPGSRPMEHQRALSQVAFSADGRFVATASRDQFVRLFDAETGYAVHPPIAHASVAKTIAFHPDGTTLISGGSDSRLVVLPLPQPLTGRADRIVQRVRRQTGLWLTEDRIIRDLARDQWDRDG